MCARTAAATLVMSSGTTASTKASTRRVSALFK
jgi:hypothetical protein